MEIQFYLPIYIYRHIAKQLIIISKCCQVKPESKCFHDFVINVLRILFQCIMPYADRLLLLG